MKLLHLFVACIFYRAAKAESQPRPTNAEPLNEVEVIHTAAPLELIDVVPGVEEIRIQPVVDSKSTKEQGENIVVNVGKPDVQILPMPIAVGEPSGGHVGKPQILPHPIAVGEPNPGKESVDFSLDGYFYRGSKKIASYRIDFKGVHFKKDDKKKKNKTEDVIDEIIDLVEGPDVDDVDEVEEVTEAVGTTTDNEQTTEAPAITTEAVRPTEEDKATTAVKKPSEEVIVDPVPKGTAAPKKDEEKAETPETTELCKNNPERCKAAVELTEEERHRTHDPSHATTAAPIDKDASEKPVEPKKEETPSIDPTDSVTAAPIDKEVKKDTPAIEIAELTPSTAAPISNHKTDNPAESDKADTPCIEIDPHKSTVAPISNQNTDKPAEPKNGTPAIEIADPSTAVPISNQKTDKPAEPKKETPEIEIDEMPATTTGAGPVSINKNTDKPAVPSKNETPEIIEIDEPSRATAAPISNQKTDKPVESDKAETPEMEIDEVPKTTTGAGPIGVKNTEKPVEPTKKGEEPTAAPVIGNVVYTGAPPKPEFGPGKCSPALVFAYDAKAKRCLASSTQVCSESEWAAVKDKTYGACMKAAPREALEQPVMEGLCNNGFVLAQVPGEPSALLYGKLCKDNFCPKDITCVQQIGKAHCCILPRWAHYG